MAGAVKRHRFTIDQYHRMGEAGILSEDEPVELIAGEIVVREPIGSRPAGTVNRLNRLWTSRQLDLVRQLLRHRMVVDLPPAGQHTLPSLPQLPEMGGRPGAPLGG